MKVDVQQIKQRFGIIGNNPGLNRAIDVALQVAPTDLSVLITGESGVGKETFPQIIHQNSRKLWRHSGRDDRLGAFRARERFFYRGVGRP